MRNRAMAGIIVTLCLCAFGDPSESGVPTSPLAIYSGGLSIGTLHSLNDTLKMESKTFFKLSFINDVYLTDNAHLFIDVDWMAPRANFDADVGVDYLFMTTRFRPFLGAGVGAGYFDKKRYSFGDNVGPLGTVHAGFLADISKTIQMRLRVPFHIVLDRTSDCAIGMDIGILFSKPYRQVKKLDY
jgi:hypothetical protein